MFFAACDKIEPEDYTMFAGANGTWYDSDADITPTQRALIEKYTGVRCVYCPDGDAVISEALAKYDGQLLAFAVHAGKYAIPIAKEPDLRTDKGTIWYTYFGITGQPASMINRSKTGSSWDIFTPTASFDNRVDAVINQAAKIGIMSECSASTDGSYDVDTHIEYLEDIDSKLTLTLVLIEDGIITPQHWVQGNMEEYEQNHVLREVITDEWGIDVDADGKKGTKRFVRLNFKPENIINPAKCKLIAFVSYKDSREVLNSAECHLTSH